jgi:hypothetical protein
VSDESVAATIEQLVAEEHELHNREHTDADRDALAADQDRLEAVQVELDQCWDLLRQRRALRDAGDDPDAAKVRNARHRRAIPAVALRSEHARGGDRSGGWSRGSAPSDRATSPQLAADVTGQRRRWTRRRPSPASRSGTIDRRRDLPAASRFASGA